MLRALVSSTAMATENSTDTICTVVAVVSEETGAISVMIRGTLRRHLSPETLGRILSNELLPREETGTQKKHSRLLFWKGRGTP